MDIEEEKPQRKQGGGFGALSPQRRKEIARLGGIAAHAVGAAHEWSHDEAVIVGKKGGTVSRRRRREAVQSVGKEQ